ncbi:DUF5131 family protein [Methylobacterium oryzihabitans]|uniref:Phage Gp37/Gp68 family protein n=1 Tax=Methylobacterium oryzihabitans TaxID=2499852 RepID=A0A437NYZ9_9HYPH|nr:phage Gp37/Gp68 family protein [Methylobacterium oryzihabitans]RVU15200.1 phage Gp37/Gp68 family protein [Methylobacterium oryzihabitans]
MADGSKIEWTETTWNPIRGCTRVSPGCGGPGPHGGCYAERVAARFSGPGQPYEGLAEVRDGKPRWTGRVSFGHNLDAPLRWRRPRRIFVNSMSDLFHEALPVEEIATVYAVCVAAHHLNGHTFQILTKRSARMRAILADEAFWDQVNAEADAHVMDGTDPLARRSNDARATLDDYGPENPPPGIWLGVSCEDQQRADERIPDLLATPAAVRWVSAEPLIEAVDFERITVRVPGEPAGFHHYVNALTGEVHDDENGTIDGVNGDDPPPRLAWVVVGGESGRGARAMNPQWARLIRDQCRDAGVRFFFKQWGEFAPVHELRSNDPSIAGRLWHNFDPDTSVCRIGKTAAGRLLDGVEHNAMPEAHHVGH